MSEATTQISALPPADRALIVLNSTKTEADLRAMVEESATIQEIKDKTGREQAHLRAIAGSTQINAGELRSLPLPSMNIIEAIGCRVSDFPTLEEIDAAVEAELGLSAASRKVAA